MLYFLLGYTFFLLFCPVLFCFILLCYILCRYDLFWYDMICSDMICSDMIWSVPIPRKRLAHLFNCPMKSLVRSELWIWFQAVSYFLSPLQSRIHFQLYLHYHETVFSVHWSAQFFLIFFFSVLFLFFFRCWCTCNEQKQRGVRTVICWIYHGCLYWSSIRCLPEG